MKHKMYFAPHIKTLTIRVDSYVLAASNNALVTNNEKTETVIDQETTKSGDAWTAQGKQNSFFDDDETEW